MTRKKGCPNTSTTCHDVGDDSAFVIYATNSNNGEKAYDGKTVAK